MWLIPFSPGLDHVVTIRFDRAESIAGLRFWNYNKSPEDTYRGVSWGIAAALSPLSGKQRLDEWLVWLPERSINLPELSKWSWGVTARERVHCYLLLLQPANVGSRAQGRLGTQKCFVSSGGRGSSAGPALNHNGGLGPCCSLSALGARP